MGSGAGSSDNQVTFRFGVWYGRCSRTVVRGLEMRVLDGVSTRSLPGFGCESFVVFRCTGFMDGDCPGNLSLGQHTGDGKFDGESFLGRTWMLSDHGTLYADY